MAVQINVAANQAALTASIQAGVQAYNQRFAQNNQLNLTVNQRAFSQPLGRMTGDVKDFEAALAASNARVIAFGASTAVLGGVIRSFKELASVTIDVEKNLADINRVFGLTTSQLQKFSTDLFNVSKQTASSFDDASKAALEFSRQGLKAEDTLQRTKDALTLTRLAGISTANAVDALTSTVNGFAATGITTTQILNKLVAVEQDYAVGAGDLAEALSRTGQAAQEAGVSLDQLNALVTSAQQSTARGGAVIGNALKTIFTRLQRTETLDQLEAFNIAVRDVEGNILPAVQILQNFAGAYRGLADAQRAQLSEQVAGVYQVNILKAIVNDLNKSQGVYAGALQRGASATNEAEVATAKLNQTLDALLKQTAVSTQQLANNIGKVTFEPLAKYGTEQLKSFIEGLNTLLEGDDAGALFANGFLKGIRNVIAGPGAIAAFFTLFKLIQNSFTYLSQALPQIAGITTETQNRKNIEQSILQIMQQQGPASQALSGLMGNQAAQAQLLLQIARQQTAEYQMQSTLAKQLAAQLATQGVRVKGSGGLQVTRAGGYIPNATRMAEVVGAQAGGYTPGRVVSSPVGGVMNTAEDVKYIPGFAQPFINPPAGSKAGRAHRQNAISRTGVDPYMFNGFIPNFAIKKIDQFAIGRGFEASVGNDIGVSPAYNAAIDFNEVRFKPINKGFNPRLYKSNSFADAHAGYGHTASQNISKIINHLGENYYGYLPKQGSSSRRIKLNDKSSLISNEGLLGDLFIRPYYTEIIGDGSDSSSVTQTSLISSLKTTAKNNLLNDLPDSEKKNILKRKITMQFAQDKVYGSGFIPNFAPPTSAIRVPWFKKFGNPAFDAIQPALGISKASDVDTFRQVNFRSSAKGADKVGDNNIFAPLYEDFVFKAMQLVSQSKIKDQLIRGYALQPGTDQKQSAFDAFLGDIALEYKGFPKANLTGSISGNLNDKYERFAKANPAGAAKIKESIITFNELGHENQLPSAFGKTFSQLAGTSYSQMAKSSPDLVKGLSAETNSLLNSYVKNPAFLAMASASGFIPNFAYKQAVMGLEESMSGNKAIFDTKPFPHIRNSSQPTFSSAIADHGGLGNALSDSMRGQKAAGLMHGGFIPNFGNSRSARRKMARNQTQSQSQNAQSGFDPAILQAEAEKIAKNVVKKMKYAYDYIGVFAAAFADTIEKGSQQAKAALSSGMSKIKVSASNLGANVSNSVNNAASNATNQNTSGGGGKSIIGAVSKRLGRIAANPFTTIAGNMLAGQIESFYTGGKSREKLTEQERFKSSAFSNVLASGSTGLQIGGMIGGAPGAVIGGVLGGLTGLITAINSSKTNLDDLTKIYEEKKIKEKESFDAASEYIQAKSKIAANENIKDANKLGKEASLAFANIKDSNLKNALSDAGNDVVKMTNILNEYTLKQKEATLNIETFSANLVGLTKERAKEVGMKTTGPTSGLYGLEIVQSLKSMLTKDTSALTKLDLIDPDTQKAVYQQNEQFFSMFRNVQSESLKKIQAGISGMYVSFIPDFVGNFEKSINSITELSKDQKEVLIATLKKGKETGSVLVKTLADPAAFNKLFSELSMYFALKKAEEIITTKNAEAVADLNFQLKKSIIYLNTRIQDESRLLNQEKRLRQVKSKTEGYVTEQLYGKREMASYQYKIAMSDIGASRSIKDLDSISKVITTNVEGLSDAQKIDLAKTRESLDLKDPQKALAQMRGFAQRTFGTLDPLKLVDSQKTFVEAIDAASEELRKNSKDAASDLEEAAAQLKAAFEEINLSSNFMFQFKAGFRDLANEGEALIGTIGRQIPKMFADGLVDGIKAAIRESDNLGQALMGIAAKFLDELSTMMLRSSIYQIMGSFAPSLVQGYGVDLSGSIRKQQKGGVIRAQSGMYVSGSGTGDKYPALLENGEYVLNRRAVMAMGGPASLDQLNFAMAPRFASGGSFSNEFTDLKSMEANMTTYGMENSKLYGELRDAEVAAAEERRRKAFANKQQRAALIGSLVAAVASIGLAQGMSNIAQNTQSKQAQALSGKLTSGANLTKAESASIKPFIDKGLISPYSGAYTGGSSYSGVKSFFSGPTAYGQSPWYQKMNPFGKQTGGLIGSRLSDTIPGYMEGGLYNTPIVKRYGVGMQAGGMSPISNSNSNVVNTTNATNSFNFNTNVSRDGTIEVGSSSTSYAQQDVALSKNLNSKVYAVVLDAIKNEQRFGGSLAGTRQG
jgi:TP901 family phage tail tape measure protein